jgi:GNAT superfamily N-acetyltransferase
MSEAASFEVRRADLSDVVLVSSILTEAAVWLEARGEPLWALSDLTPEKLTPEVTAGLYFIAFVDSADVGVLRLTFDDPLFWGDVPAVEAAYVHKLAVRRAYAGGTLSFAMLRWAAGEAKQRGCEYLRLDCRTDRIKLREVYERFGFRYHSDREVGPFVVARYELRVPLT